MTENKRYCSNCGAEIDAGAKFCGYCGEAVKIDVNSTFEHVPVTIPSTQYDYPNPNAVQYTQSEINYEEQLIGNKAYYYKEKFKKMRESGGFISLNWCALFFNSLWFVYRKMYMETLIVMAASYFVATMFSETTFMSLIVPILCGIFGNYTYMKKIEGKVAHAQELSTGERERYIAKAGGTNVGAVLLLLFLYSFVIVGIMFLAVQLMTAI